MRPRGENIEYDRLRESYDKYRAEAMRQLSSLERRYMDLGELAARYREALREIADKADDPHHVAYEEACIARRALTSSETKGESGG